MISFVIPAHNEQTYIGGAVAAIQAAMHDIGRPFEIVVVDDASTDATAEVAQSHGARVIFVNHRKISATRNAGAAVTSGEILFFVDADTLASAAAIRAALAALDAGAVGGGCVFKFDGRLPLWAKVAYPIAVLLARLLRLVGGCFLFCHRTAYDAAGGFCEEFYAAEEVAFIRALKKQGRFVVPRPTVVTSGRKLRDYSGWRIIGEAWRWAIHGPAAFKQRDGLDIWYGPRG